jgi:hypothetical protein
VVDGAAVKRLQRISLFLLFGLSLAGCGSINDVPPRAVPMGLPTNPPPPRAESHRPDNGTRGNKATGG